MRISRWPVRRGLRIARTFQGCAGWRLRIAQWLVRRGLRIARTFQGSTGWRLRIAQWLVRRGLRIARALQRGTRWRLRISGTQGLRAPFTRHVRYSCTAFQNAFDDAASENRKGSLRHNFAD